MNNAGFCLGNLATALCRRPESIFDMSETVNFSYLINVYESVVN